MEFKQISLHDAQIKFADDGINSFSGYASVFNGVDSYGDTIHPGAFTKALEGGTEIKMYYNHGWRKDQMPIGKMFVKQDDLGLFVERAEFTKGIQLAEDVSLAVKHGTIDGISIGFGMKETGFKRKASGGKDIYEIHMLKEVSIVDYPADDNARIMAIKSAIDDITNLKQAEAFFRDEFGLSWTAATALVSQIKSVALRDGDAEAMKQLAEKLEATFAQF
jgi:HK97 family phage prohead protease